MDKVKLQVYDVYNSDAFGGEAKGLRDVDAYVVGGIEGVFAVWQEGDAIYFASGDDGNWWIIKKFDQNWFPSIFSAIYKLYLDYYLNKLREKKK